MNRKTLILTALMVLGFAALAYASGGEGGENPWKPFAYTVVNFAVLVIVLFVFAKKPLAGFFNSRIEEIKKSVEDAAAAKALAQKALDEIAGRLANKDAEIKQMMDAAQEAGTKEREHLIAEGERMARNLVEQARKNIDFEYEQARQAIRAEAVELAMELAETKIKSKVSDTEQKKLFEDALKRLEDRS